MATILSVQFPMINFLEQPVSITLRKNKLRSTSKKVQSIIRIKSGMDFEVVAAPGSISDKDLVVQYKDLRIKGSKYRQPHHIHWAVDLLIKKEKNKDLTEKFLVKMLDRWNTILPLSSRREDDLKNQIILATNQEFIVEFADLNNYGFFSIEFVTLLMELLAIQEKANNPNAYMFKDTIDMILHSKDLYKIIANASFKGGVR